MKLHAKSWIYAGGLSAEWKGVGRLRVEKTLSALRAVRGRLAQAPPEVRKKRYLAGLDLLLKSSGSDRDRLLCDPALDYWLFLWDKHFHLPCRAQDWHLQMGTLQGFAAALALGRNKNIHLDGMIDPNGEFRFYGSPDCFVFPAELAHSPAQIDIRGGRASVKAGGALGERQSAPRLSCGIAVEDRAWLLMHGVSMHGLANLSKPEKEKFIAVLDQALADMKQRDPLFYSELSDMLRVLVPLENPMKFGSVSSSYVNMRGTICLSHSDDPLLQAETLIHEFCHQKMNQLLIADPVILAGQSGQVFYSPWRKDARRLRGLMLGAHAFLNVARYLLKSVGRDGFSRKESLDVMVNIALRLYQVQEAMRTLSFYGDFTPFGRSFIIGMWQELGLLFHGVQWFPGRLLQEAEEKFAKHRKRHALFGTGFHRSAEFQDKIKRAPFLTRGGVQS